MKIVYVGPHDAVEVAPPQGGVIVCPRGQAVDVPDELAASLVEQGTFERAKGPAKSEATPKEEEKTDAGA